MEKLWKPETHKTEREREIEKFVAHSFLGGISQHASGGHLGRWRRGTGKEWLPGCYFFSPIFYLSFCYTFWEIFSILSSHSSTEFFCFWFLVLISKKSFFLLFEYSFKKNTATCFIFLIALSSLHESK